MHRHMQNFSFFAILAVLLGCAFFFSQLTELSDTARLQTDTPDAINEPLADIPPCDDSLDDRDALTCYNDAVQVSQQWVDHAVDELSVLETAVDERMAFMETQLAWEESRDADCEFIHDKSNSSQIANLRQAKCLLSHNLARLEQLESYLCELYGASDCDQTEVTSP